MINFVATMKKTWNIELALIKWVRNNKTFSVYGGSLLLTLIVFLSMWEPTFILHILNSILWFVTFGQVMPASWYGNGSDAPHFTLHLIIKLTVEGENGWYGELNKGGYAVGVVLLSLISMCVVPFVRIGLSNHLKDIQSIQTAKDNFIQKFPAKFETEQELYKEVKDFIYINMDHLSTNAIKRHRREFIISSMVIELWEKPRQHTAIN